MQIILVSLFVVGLSLTIIVAIRQAPGYHKRQDEQQRMAITLNPVYRAKVEEDRRYHLALEKLDQEKVRFNHQVTTDMARLWLDSHVLPAERYLYNAPVESILALPSLKRETQPAQPAGQTIVTELPEPYDFLQELAGWRPNATGIFLGRNREQAILLPAGKLWHIALAGPTGGGKSTILRIILAQLLYLQAYTCYLCDINYAPIKQTEEGPLDWRPIAERLAVPPIRDVKPMHELVEWLAQGELQARRDRENRGEPIGKPIFVSFDELPAVMDEDPKIAQPLMKILRQGRQYGIFFIGATQDMLVDTLKTTGAVRECFRTSYYVGGDQKTARVLLDLASKDINEQGLGYKGQVYLKTAATVAQEVRVPYVSNQAVYELLPVSSSTSMPASINTTIESNVKPDMKPVEAALDVRSLRIRDLLKAGKSQRQIIQEVWGVSSGGAYTKAAAELSQIIATLL